MSIKHFEKAANAIAARQDPRILLLWHTMGLEQFAEDHVVCLACAHRSDGGCSAVEAAQVIIALAEEHGVPREEL